MLVNLRLDLELLSGFRGGSGLIGFQYSFNTVSALILFFRVSSHIFWPCFALSYYSLFLSATRLINVV